MAPKRGGGKKKAAAATAVAEEAEEPHQAEEVAVPAPVEPAVVVAEKEDTSAAPAIIEETTSAVVPAAAASAAAESDSAAPSHTVADDAAGPPSTDAAAAAAAESAPPTDGSAAAASPSTVEIPAVFASFASSPPARGLRATIRPTEVRFADCTESALAAEIKGFANSSAAPVPAAATAVVASSDQDAAFTIKHLAVPATELDLLALFTAPAALASEADVLAKSLTRQSVGVLQIQRLNLQRTAFAVKFETAAHAKEAAANVAKHEFHRAEGPHDRPEVQFVSDYKSVLPTGGLGRTSLDTAEWRLTTSVPPLAFVVGSTNCLKKRDAIELSHFIESHQWLAPNDDSYIRDGVDRHDIRNQRAQPSAAGGPGQQLGRKRSRSPARRRRSTSPVDRRRR